AVEGGLMEDIKQGDMVAEFDAWIFDEARKEGDYDIVKTQYGYHLVYFQGAGEEAWKVDVDTVLREADYSEKYDSILNVYPVVIDGMEVYRYEGKK
ncbi:MAG: peptidylprolyl isomerase, partial [Clostridia bacterium]|nr:peptidylprolyl isomerase [Clostridia bacterium]